MAALIRDQLRTAAKRIVVKVGSAVITHDKGHLSTPRLVGIVEQMAQLQEQGRQLLLVTSGSVAFGRKKIHDHVKKATQISNGNHKGRPQAQSREAAAVGQSSLMSFYESLFQQYDCQVAQVLVTNADFRTENRKKLRNLLIRLLNLNIVPILNTNDAVEALVTRDMNDNELKQADMTDIIVEDNDSLAAKIATEINSDLLIMLSNVDGVYSGSPGEGGSKFISSFTPNMYDSIEFGAKSDVGLGGMQSKVRSALWALKKGTSVVICNGSLPGVIERVVNGDKVGTFFTNAVNEMESANLAQLARDGSRKLLSAGPEVRSQIIRDIAQALETNSARILAANELDLVKAKQSGLEDVLVARLKLTEDKLKSLSLGLNQIASKSKDQVDKTTKRVKISETLMLRQITSPIGVLMVIFESRPDCLPQITSLSIATANGLLLKGGKEASESNKCLYNIIKTVLADHGCQDAIQLVDTRERVSELVGLDDQIDLIIPRGSNQLVRSIQEQAGGTPVLGHAEGICHVYIDQHANHDNAIRIAIDSKCNYPAACNAMETLLIHKSLIDTDLFAKLCDQFKAKQVKVNFGARLAKHLSANEQNEQTTNYKIEYGRLECTFELVADLNEAIEHINEFGSGHTDSIVTNNEQVADRFKRDVDSASVFVNCSTRFADGYRYGLGAEVGISTSRIHARGPAGMESLLTHKWIVEGSGDTVDDYEGQRCTKSFVHEEILAH